MEATYLDSLHFRDIYIHLQQNGLPSNKSLAKRMEIQVNNYLLLHKLIFKLMPNAKGYLHPFIMSSLIGGHNGIMKTYRTISDRFYYPNLAFDLRAYITGSHLCQ